jgi:adenylate kinase family enzyme
VRRIAVIGSGGSGKSTFADGLGERLGVPVIHLDHLYWRPGWQPTPDEEWRAVQRHLVLKESWIMDGNYGSTLEIRLAVADAVYFFDLPTWRSLVGVLARWVRNHGKAIQAEGCPEHVSWEFLRWVWRYRRDSRPRVVAALREHAGSARVVVIRSRRDAARALTGAA